MDSETPVEEKMRAAAVLCGISFALLVGLFVYVFRVRSNGYYLVIGLRAHPVAAAGMVLLLDAWVALLALTAGEILRAKLRARAPRARGGGGDHDDGDRGPVAAAPRAPGGSAPAGASAGARTPFPITREEESP